MKSKRNILLLVIGDVLSNPILTDFLRLKSFNKAPVKLLPTYHPCFPSCMCSTEKAQHFPLQRGRLDWLRGPGWMVSGFGIPHLHGQVRRQSAINEGQRCGQAAAHRYPTKEGHPEKLTRDKENSGKKHHFLRST